MRPPVFRDYLVTVWSKRTAEAIVLRIRERTAKDAAKAARAAGWHDGILAVDRVES